jgi:hypothetical protein
MIFSKMRAFAGQTRLLLLAPSGANVPAVFRNQQYDPARHERLLGDMQRFRGRVYLQDGAIERDELTDEGRHRVEVDGDSWHLLAMDGSGAICGCVRYCAHEGGASFSDLWVRHSALANSPVWGRKFRSAVESGMEQARRRKVSYVEVGGWAISEERRWTVEALRIALATYGLARMLGGCIGITTATMRHCSASILRRLGGSTLPAGEGGLPPYYDPQFKCDMEVLHFDSEYPAPKYDHMVNQLSSDILAVPVIRQKTPQTPLPGSTKQIGIPTAMVIYSAPYTLQPA